MSWLTQGLGSGPGGVPPPPVTGPTAIESYTPVVSVLLLWLTVARPTVTPLPIDTDSVPTAVHVDPSGDTEPVKVLPVRASFSQTGEVRLVDAMTDDD